jgi:hypothetical protein
MANLEVADETAERVLGHSLGVKLGRNGARLARANKAKADVARLAPIVADIRASGVTTVRAIAHELNRRRIASPLGGQWSKSTVAVLLSRLAA